MFAWLKKYLSAEDSDERFRVEFEKSKTSTGNFRRVGDEYTDPATQQEWRQWVDLQRLSEIAW